MTTFPRSANGNYLGWRQRLRYRLGLKPWRECPGRRHYLTALYGDGLRDREYRVYCEYCTARWKGLAEAHRDTVTVGWRKL